MALECATAITPISYTHSGVTDENYSIWTPINIYSKSQKVIQNSKIYEARTVIPIPTYYLYNKAEDSLYIPSSATFVESATFKAISEFENKYIYLDDTNVLYKYIGSTDITINPNTIVFTDTSKWQNLGVQLNGYSVDIYSPNTTPLYWKYIEDINSQKLLDNRNSSQTVGNVNIPMIYTFATSGADRIYLSGMLAEKLTVKVHLGSAPESPDNTVETEYLLYTQAGNNFYDILTSPIALTTTKYIKIPTAGIQTITIKLEATNEPTRIGDITLAKSRELGVVLDGINYDNKDYSTYSSDTDATDEYTEGGYRNINSFTVSFDSVEIGYVKKQLDQLRGKVVVFNLDSTTEKEHLILKGFMRSRPIDYLTNNTKSKINIKLEGRIE